MKATPMVVHCCHCRWCQRETGTAFALNAVIESANVELLGEAPERCDLPTETGRIQSVLRCPHCKIAVWSHYPQSGEVMSFIRVGTLDHPDACPPDVHIYTDSKQLWVIIPEGAKQFPEFYAGKDVPGIYGPEGAARLRAVRAGS
jgi:hypothetical protein